MKLGQKAQEFSVFKLLIAAVVALAILAILIPILNSIGIIGLSNPTDEAAKQVKAVYNSPGEHVKTSSVTFQPETRLSASSIASKSGVIDETYLCLNKGDLEASSTFDYVPASGAKASVIRYKGSANLAVKLSVICGAGQSLVTEFATVAKADGGLGLVGTTIEDHCPGISADPAQWCLIALRSNA